MAFQCRGGDHCGSTCLPPDVCNVSAVDPPDTEDPSAPSADRSAWGPLHVCEQECAVRCGWCNSWPAPQCPSFEITARLEHPEYFEEPF